MANGRRINVDATSARRIDVYTTPFLRHVPAGIDVYTVQQSFLGFVKHFSLFDKIDIEKVQVTISN